MTRTSNFGIYIHIPFCVRKCRYCDFLSFRCEDDGILRGYTEALLKEMELKSKDLRYRYADSVYIGGGTPSILSAWDMGKILETLRESFNITDDAEITIEANPATLTDEKLERYLRKGANRLSIGVQSFDNRLLGLLGRIHNKNDALYTFQKAKKAGFENINLDLMFGIPGQTMKMWKDTVRECVFLRPAHISLYSLQIEEGTEFYEMYRDGRLEEVSDSLDREMYHVALRVMCGAGYRHYEISNCALAGFAGRHNMRYWSYEDYIGLGPGASSFIGGRRFENLKVMTEYLDALKEDVSPVDTENIKSYSRREEMGIFVFTGLRKAEGISLEEFRDIFGEDFFSVYDQRVLKKYKGLLILADGRLYLSEKGMDVSNRIMTEFV